MKIAARLTLIFLTFFGVTNPAWSQTGYDNDSLGGRIFAITGEYLFVDPNLGLPIVEGDTFENCYTFQADETPGQAPRSGVWNDPLFPAPGEAVPGIWVQHTRNPGILYTAFADDGAGVTLTQNGTVKAIFAKRNVRLTAYSTVHVAGLGAVISVLSKGYQVEQCPDE